MYRYCYQCDATTRFVEKRLDLLCCSECRKARCQVRSESQLVSESRLESEFSVRVILTDRGYVITNFRCENHPDKDDFTVRVREFTLVCQHCGNPYLMHKTYKDVCDRLIGTMRYLFYFEEDFNFDIWNLTFPLQLKILANNAKLAKQALPFTLDDFLPPVIANIVCEYTER